MSFKRSIPLFVVIMALAAPVWAKPGNQGRMPKIEALDLSGSASDLSLGHSSVMQAASAGTTWFGGTLWAADSQRWEAYPDGVWTFDSGVGSSIVPPGGPQNLSQPTASWVNPYKRPGLHATMEGWIGIDETYSEITYFRRIASTDPGFSGVKCTGAAAGLQGTYSYWCGVFASEAAEQCYAGGQGYGNGWNVCIEHSFNYPGGSVTLGFQYKNETEDSFDFTHVYVDTSSDGDNVEVASYTGALSGSESLALTQGVHLPRVIKPIKIKFCVSTDGAWSDQDGLFNTTCGAFAVDNITTGGAITHSANFEDSDNGWTLSTPPPGLGGEWSNIYHVDDLPPPITSCACALYDSVLAFTDDNNSHPIYQSNLAASPWIDLKAAGAQGSTGRVLRTNMYLLLPLLNYVFFYGEAQWYPDVCLQTGKLVRSAWQGFPCFIYYYGPSGPQCTSTAAGAKGTVFDLTCPIPAGVEQVRIAVGVVSYCRFFSNCNQVSNTSPWFDQMQFGVYGDPNVPFIAADELGRAQDNFPENGTLNLYATGRVDSNDIQGDSQPEIGTALGDTLVVYGGVGNAEVYVHFRVTPGPGTHPSRFSAWFQKHAGSTVEPGFRMARMDTAEYGNSGPMGGKWMTAYHESDPNFWISDRTLDPNDISPIGGMWRLDNDIFPDDLFTAGTRLDYFFSANKVGESNYIRDPASGYYEMEILPSSMTAAQSWNCVLYVDHINRGSQHYVENALSSVLGTGSENFETTNWDRYDVNGASSQQASFGRPLQTEYGATLTQTFAYRTILWDSGNLNAFNLVKEDADVLLPWLTLDGLGQHNLYLSGDGVVFSPISEGESEPSAKQLIQNVAGITILTNCSTGTFRNASCPTSGAPQDLTSCVNLDPVSGSLVANHPARNEGHLGQGNGCPELRSFDVLSLLTPQAGTVTGDERYSSPIKSANYASAATNVPVRYKIVADGLTVSERRDVGGPCDYLAGGKVSVTERLNEVLTYFGYPSGPCSDPTIGVGIPEPEKSIPIRTRLEDVSPNPLGAGRMGRIRFTMPVNGSAKVEVFNLQGRMVRTLFDGQAAQGQNELSWNGTDAAGQQVASGVYYLRLHTRQEDLSRRVVVLKTP